MDDAVKRYRARRAKRLSRIDAKFEESEHPRDESGKFTSGGGSSGKPTGFEQRMKTYIGGGVRTDVFSKEDVDYIKKNMKTQNTGMFRIEDAGWMSDKLSRGKIFAFDKDLKSFSRSQRGAENVLANAEDYGTYDDPVVFMTTGKIKHFPVEGYSDDHSEEEESLVGGKFRVTHIGLRKIGKKNMKCYFIEQVKE